jgi:hypothetical protein
MTERDGKHDDTIYAAMLSAMAARSKRRRIWRERLDWAWRIALSLLWVGLGLAGANRVIHTVRAFWWILTGH